MSGAGAIGWLRVSSGDQDLENQRPALIEAAERRGETITEWVELEASAYSGAHLAELARVQRSFKRRGGPRTLYVWSLDRLSRQGPLATLQAVAPIYDAGGTVVSIREAWLEQDVGGMRDLLVSFLGWVARWESEHRSERTKAGISRARAAGVPHGRPRNCLCGDPAAKHPHRGPCRALGCSCTFYVASATLLRPSLPRRAK